MVVQKILYHQKYSHTLIFSNPQTLKLSDPQTPNPAPRISNLTYPETPQKSPETEIPRLYSKNRQ